MELLITGFEPFGGSQINPSEQVIRMLGRQRLGNVSITSLLLPVDRTLGPQKLLQTLKDNYPDAVLCLGEATGRPSISVERVAINLLDFKIPDNAGVQVTDEVIITDGPAAYFSSLPVRQIYDAIKNAGIPVELSLSAGSYLCNQTLYQLLHYISRCETQIPAGFIHLPSLPEQAANQSKPISTMSLETSLKAVREAIRCIVEWTSRPPI